MSKPRSAPLIVLAGCFFVLSVAFHGHVQKLNQDKRYLIPPPEGVEHFHFGFNESMADSFWLRWIQDSDYCQVYGKEAEKVESKEDRSEFAYSPRHKNCDGSWAYKMLDLVTRLAPKFLMPYTAGAITLSVLIEDFEGASRIFERGLEEYPNDWQLAYRASYHYLFDRKDFPRAAALLNKAQSLGGPAWLSSLASRLYSKSGQLELGLSTLTVYRETLSDEKTIKEVDKRIAEMKRELRESSAAF